MGIDASIRRILPKRLADALDAALSSVPTGSVQCLRLRRDKPLSVTVGGVERFLSLSGQLELHPSTPLMPTAADLEDILVQATQGSFYAAQHELRRGYFTLPGGHRLGMAGEAVLGTDAIQTLKHVNSVQIRVAHQVRGCADSVMSHIVRGSRARPLHTLIVGPPGSGKTTLLRDVARQLADGTPSAAGRGFQVAIADERSEIAGSYRGEPQLDVGLRTDVLDGAPKSIAISMLIRSMSPDVVVTDEIGAPEDAAAIRDLIRCGVTLIASAHGTDLAELRSRPMLRGLLEEQTFQRLIFLSARQGVGTVERVVDPSQALASQGRVRTGTGRWSP